MLKVVQRFLLGWLAFLYCGAFSANGAPNGALDDTNIKYFGRWVFTNSSQYASYWGGAYIKVNFSGTTAKIKLGYGSGYGASFYAKIDDGSWLSYSNVTAGTLNLTPIPLANGIHSLSVAQGQDYNYVFEFQGLIFDSGATTSVPVVASNLIEFIGDSITTGYTDPQANVSDYAWICSQNLNCEHTQIAYPGVDLVSGYPVSAPATGQDMQYFKEQSFAYANSPVWNFPGYPARAVVINLGQNDGGANSVPGLQFQNDYVSFMSNIRTNYPGADIFAMRDFNGFLASNIKAAVNARNSAGDLKVHYIDTTGWLTSTDYNDGVHPSVSGHIKAANLLQPILAPYVNAGAAYNPVINGCRLSGTSCVINVTNGPPGMNYEVMMGTSLLMPLINWTALTTNTFSASGSFNFTNSVILTNQHQFYIIYLP